MGWMAAVEMCTNPEEWDDVVLSLGGHPLQLWGWGQVKAAHNWNVVRVFVRENKSIIGAAQILTRSLPWPLNSLAYVPRGPVAREEDRGVVLDAVAEFTRRTYRPVALTAEPDWETMPELEGWQQSPNTILIPHTLILDLMQSEDDLLAHMTKKTRQYIRKSEKEGVQVRMAKSGEDIAACLEIYKQTAARAGFGLHGDEYYEDIAAKMGDHSQIFMATAEGRAVAFLWLAVSEETAFELYGGMNDEGQELRANYVLKWTAIRRFKEWGIRRYDMNGLLNDGVSKFKQGFADHETMLVGTYDKPLSPLYPLWTKGLPAAKNLVRKLKNR
jgi:lipid II:glycine glycyltransferase (peptidoglycan interpeptide bridge formation enzyme)